MTSKDERINQLKGRQLKDETSEDTIRVLNEMLLLFEEKVSLADEAMVFLIKQQEELYGVENLQSKSSQRVSPFFSNKLTSSVNLPRNLIKKPEDKGTASPNHPTNSHATSQSQRKGPRPEFEVVIKDIRLNKVREIARNDVLPLQTAISTISVPYSLNLMELFIQSLKFNSTLNLVDFSNTKLEERAAFAFSESLKQNSTISVVILEGTFKSG
jgi:hypothetical protein